MTDQTKKQVVWGIRILVSALFVLSAVAKLYPSPILGISAFETKYLGAIGIEDDLARIVSRMLIGFEFSLAVLLLLPYYFKKIIVPVTIGLLGIFSIHLLVQVIHGDAGNCGCFGELIPMTPLQALIKNVLTIGLLFVLLRPFKDQVVDDRKLSPIPICILSCILAMFVFLLPTSSSSFTAESSTEHSLLYNSIQKKKILCYFDPSCEHCMDAGKEIVKLKKENKNFPEVKILFMDAFANGMEEEMKQFFEYIGMEFDYQLLSITEFNPIFWDDNQFPGVLYMYQGKDRIFFEGNDDNKFDPKKLMQEINKDK